MSSEFNREGDSDPLDLDRVLVCFAVEQEAKFFSQPRGVRLFLHPQEPGIVEEPSMEILITGIGRENAERKLHIALRKEPYQLVLSCGFAGGLNPYLSTGTVVFSADEDAGLTDVLLTAGACPVRFHSTDRVATTVA